MSYPGFDPCVLPLRVPRLQRPNARCACSLLLLLSLVFAGTEGGLAQATSGMILGQVLDSSGAAIPGAAVTVTNVATAEAKNVETDASGNYQVVYLIPGRYEVAAQKTGFATVKQTAFELQVDQKARIDLTLPPGSTSETVSVSTETPVLKTESSEQGEVITARQITTLPLNVRNFSQLLDLTTGTSPNHSAQGGSVGADHPEGISATNVNGLPSDGNNWQIDGVSDNEAFFSVLTVNPSIDAIQEFKATTSNYSAEFGRAGGAHVEISIKSGSNALHGVAFEFLRNSALDANDYFTKRSGGSIPAFKQNQFGGNIGGPIFKDKTFFFVDYEGFRSRLGETELMTLPTALQRQGIFTETDPVSGAAQATIYDPNSNMDPALRTPYPNNTVTNINPVSAKVIALLPLPNPKGANGAPLLNNNFLGSDILAHDVDQGDLRIDHRVSSRNQAFARYSNLDTTLSQPPFLGKLAGGDPFLAALSHSENQNGVVSDVHTFSPSLLNEFRFGVNSVNLDWNAFDSQTSTSSDVGIPGVNGFCAFCGGLARIQVSGISNFGHTPFAPTLRHSTVLEWIDNVTIVKGKNSLKVGADLNKIRASLFQTSNPVGEFDFDQNMTSNGSSGGIGTASFLTGFEADGTRDAMTGYPHYKTNQLFFFGEDDYRVSAKLTLNLGLRYEIYTAAHAGKNQQANFELSTGDLLSACIATSCSGGVHTDYGNYEPRVGFAYSARPHTVLRSAFGISTFPPGSGGQIGSLGENEPYEEGQQINPVDLFTPGPSIDQGLPGLPPLLPRPQAGPGRFIPTGTHILYLDPHLRMTKAYQWNLDVQQELVRNLLLDVAYVGNAVTGIYLNVPGNYPELHGDLTNPATGQPNTFQQRRPYYAVDPDLQQFTRRFNGGHSDYHSLQAKLDKRFSNGLSFLAAYTWSKDLQRGQDYVDPDFYMQKDVSGQDITHRFVASYSYELPLGRGKQFGRNFNTAMDAALGGWQVQGITTLRTGLPFTVTAPSFLDNGFSNVPNRSGSGRLAHATIDQWFDTSVFTAPGNNYGNSGFNILRGPAGRDSDMSLFKNLRFSDARYLQFRAEFFNVFNNVQFSNPNAGLCNNVDASGHYINSCGAGTITGLAAGSTPRQIQFALKLYF